MDLINFKQNGFLILPHTFTNIEIRSFVGNKNIETNISKIPANNSIMCG